MDELLNQTGREYSEKARDELDSYLDECSNKYTARTCSARTKTLILRYIAAMLRFCSEKGLCRAEFSLLLDRKIYPHVGTLHSFSEENQAIIEKNRYKSHDFPVDEYQETVEPFIETLQKHRYIGQHYIWQDIL